MDIRNERRGRFTFVHAGDEVGKDVESDGTPKQMRTVESMTAEAVRCAKATLEKTGTLMPVVHVFVPTETPSCVVMFLASGWNGKAGKREVAAAVSDYCRDHKAAAIAFAADGWYLEAPVEITVQGHAAHEAWTREQYKRYPNGLADHPLRKEMLTIQTIYPDGSCVGWYGKYDRFENDAVCTVCEGSGKRDGEQCPGCDGACKVDRIVWREEKADGGLGRGNSDGNTSRSEQMLFPPWLVGGVQ